MQYAITMKKLKKIFILHNVGWKSVSGTETLTTLRVFVVSTIDKGDNELLVPRRMTTHVIDFLVLLAIDFHCNEPPKHIGYFLLPQGFQTWDWETSFIAGTHQPDYFLTLCGFVFFWSLSTSFAKSLQLTWNTEQRIPFSLTFVSSSLLGRCKMLRRLTNKLKRSEFIEREETLTFIMNCKWKGKEVKELKMWEWEKERMRNALERKQGKLTSLKNNTDTKKNDRHNVSQQITVVTW